LLEDRLSEDLTLVERILPSADLSGRRAVGVYFEVYGASEDELLQVTLSAEPVEGQRGLLSRLGRLLGRGGGPDEARDVNWSESVETPEEGRMSRYSPSTSPDSP